MPRRSACGPTRGLAALVAAGLLQAALPLGAAELPQQAPAVHLGVRTCSGTPCHGKPAASGKVVQQNEHTLWAARSAHARAYDVLRGEPARRIARNLGLDGGAHEADLCLDCHADNVPAARRGNQFALEDGVGCEACHGGSEGWLGTHISGKEGHERNVALGMYPTDDAVARAELCASCHFGDATKFVDHRLMGAGHPRLSFELDTFGVLQPQHHRADGDYLRRGKQASPPARLWAVGQAVLARALLRRLADGAARPSPWPELVLYDCHACHHPLKLRRWSPEAAAGTGLGPGLPRLNDASLLMLRQAALAVDAEAAAELLAGTRALHAALSLGAGSGEAPARRLLATADALVGRLARWETDPPGARRVLAGLVEEGLAGRYDAFAAAEQAVMAAQALTSTLHALGALPARERDACNRAIERLLAATADEDAFAPGAFRAALEELERALGPAP